MELKWFINNVAIVVSTVIVNKDDWYVMNGNKTSCIE
jgi:hypothetical protein